MLLISGPPPPPCLDGLRTEPGVEISGKGLTLWPWETVGERSTPERLLMEETLYRVPVSWRLASSSMQELIAPTALLAAETAVSGILQVSRRWLRLEPEPVELEYREEPVSFTRAQPHGQASRRPPN